MGNDEGGGGEEGKEEEEEEEKDEGNQEDLTEAEVEEELRALEEREMFMFLSGKWDEGSALAALAQLQSSTAWGAKVHSVWRWVVGVMERFRTNVDVETRGCEVLRRCAWIMEDNERLEMAQGAAPRAIGAAMGAHSESAELHRAACSAIAAMARGKSPEVNRLLPETLLPRIIQALHRFAQDRAVCVECCRAIRSMFEGSEPAVLRKAVKLHVLESLSAVLRDPQVTPDTVMLATAAMSFVAGGLKASTLADHRVASALLVASVAMFDRGEAVASSRCLELAATCLRRDQLVQAVRVVLWTTSPDPSKSSGKRYPRPSGAVLELIGAVASLWPTTEPLTAAELTEILAIEADEDARGADPEEADDPAAEDDLTVLPSATGLALSDARNPTSAGEGLQVRLNAALARCLPEPEAEPAAHCSACNVIGAAARRWSNRASFDLAHRTEAWLGDVLERHPKDACASEAGCKAVWLLSSTVGGRRLFSANDRVTAAVAAVALANERQQKVLTAAMLAAGRLGYHRRARKLLVAQGIDALALRALAGYCTGADFVRGALCCIESLFCDAESVKRNTDPAAFLKDVVAAMVEFGSDEAVVLAGLGTLGAFAADREPISAQILVDLSVETLIAASMQKYATSKKVFISGCMAVTKLTFENSEVKALMASAGILDTAIGGLERWADDADAAYASLCAICALTVGTPTILAAPSDGFRLADALHDCMINHADNAEITALSCRAQGNLARISEEVRDYLNDLDGVSLVTEALQRFPDDVDVQVDGCTAACILVADDSVSDEAAEALGRLAISAMRGHADEPNVQKAAIAALVALCEYESCLRLCREENVRELVLRAVSEGPPGRFMRLYALRLLRRLQDSKSSGTRGGSLDGRPEPSPSDVADDGEDVPMRSRSMGAPNTTRARSMEPRSTTTPNTTEPPVRLGGAWKSVTALPVVSFFDRLAKGPQGTQAKTPRGRGLGKSPAPEEALGHMASDRNSA